MNKVLLLGYYTASGGNNCNCSLRNIPAVPSTQYKLPIPLDTPLIPHISLKLHIPLAAACHYTLVQSKINLRPYIAFP